MAKKVKFSKDRTKRFERTERGRKTNIRDLRKYYLIVCEGEETEPNYFEGLKQDLPKGVLTACHIDIEGVGRNTLSLVEKALQLKRKYENATTRPIDKLWVVFDRDSFPSQDFNSAIERCSLKDIGCAWSNEAFELWYLLHFIDCDSALHRDAYSSKIEAQLKPKLGNGFRYQKNSKSMYDLLKEHGSMENAIKHAKRLAEQFEGRTDFANHNPCTMVYKLIEEIMRIA